MEGWVITWADFFHLREAWTCVIPSSPSLWVRPHGVPPGAPAQVPASPMCVVCHLFSLFTGLPCGSVGAGDLCVDPWEQLLRFPLSGLHTPGFSAASHPRTTRKVHSRPHSIPAVLASGGQTHLPAPCKPSGHLGHFDPTRSLLRNAGLAS